MKYQKITENNSLRQEYDTIQLMLASGNQNVNQLTLRLEAIEEKASEARELAKLDPSTAEACKRILAQCATERSAVEENFAGAKRQLQVWIDQEKSFNKDGGREELLREQRIANLRAKVGNDKLREPSKGEHAPGGFSLY